MKERIAMVLDAPGWMRLFKAAAGVWFVYWVGFAVLNYLFKPYDMDDTILAALASVLVPICAYVLAKLTAWVVRGFL